MAAKVAGSDAGGARAECGALVEAHCSLVGAADYSAVRSHLARLSDLIGLARAA